MKISRCSLRLFCSALIALWCVPAAASPVVADISSYRIAMDTGFTGTRLFLFGARGDPGDVVVVVRGPLRDYTVHKKKEIAGLWINRERVKLFDIPDYYAIASSRPLEDIDSGGVFRALRIGTGHLLPGGNAIEFSNAFLNYQRERKLYGEGVHPVEFMGETLFKTTIEFPDTIPPGHYSAEIYLISEGQVSGLQVLPIEVEKIGLDAFLADYARRQPLLYGLTAIVLALAAGWFVGRAFEKV